MLQTPPVAEGRLWCPALLPDGTQGHWFFVEQGSPLVCHDPTCPLHGQIAYQYPVHRSFIGRVNASCTAANCGKERVTHETLYRQS
jgi:hypothetical protein